MKSSPGRLGVCSEVVCPGLMSKKGRGSKMSCKRNSSKCLLGVPSDSCLFSGLLCCLENTGYNLSLSIGQKGFGIA